jgi:hypothetical protein
LARICGLVVRAYSQKPEGVSGALEWLEDLIIRANAISVAGRRVFERIDVLVPGDTRYYDYDCGQTAAAAADRFAKVWNVFVEEVERGDLYCGLLNRGLYKQTLAGITHTMNLSNSVASYLTDANMAAVLEAFDRGAHFVPMALQEFKDSISRGRGLDTFDMWDNKELAIVGNYDERGSQPQRDENKETSWRWTKHNGEWEYRVAGVEEMIPSMLMWKNLARPFIAPIQPVDGGGVWKQPTDEEGLAREKKKVDSKFRRQARAAELMGEHPDVLEQAVLPAYKTS